MRLSTGDRLYQGIAQLGVARLARDRRKRNGRAAQIHGRVDRRLLNLRFCFHERDTYRRWLFRETGSRCDSGLKPKRSLTGATALGRRLPRNDGVWRQNVASIHHRLGLRFVEPPPIFRPSIGDIDIDAETSRKTGDVVGMSWAELFRKVRSPGHDWRPAPESAARGVLRRLSAGQTGGALGVAILLASLVSLGSAPKHARSERAHARNVG